MFLFQAMFAVPAFVAAFALFKKRPWARTASIVAAALAAMNVPVGTLACVYAFWFFLGENWKNVYQQPTDGVSDDQTRDLPGSR